MKIAYSVKQKTKIATLLFCIMACTILIRTLEDRNIQSLNKSFSSLYTDRLVPAMHLFHITEHLHAKQNLLNNLLQNNGQSSIPGNPRGQLSALNTAIDSLINKYEKTYLVKSETEQLRRLKLSLANNKIVAYQIAGNALMNAPLLNKEQLNASIESTFQAAVTNLKDLMNIQSQVGEELIKDSAFIISDSKIYSSLQMALAIVIGILIVGLVFASKAAMVTTEKYHLN